MWNAPTIRTLLLTFFYRYQKRLCWKVGYILHACPLSTKWERGKITTYCYNEQDLKTPSMVLAAKGQFTQSSVSRAWAKMMAQAALGTP